MDPSNNESQRELTIPQSTKEKPWIIPTWGPLYTLEDEDPPSIDGRMKLQWIGREYECGCRNYSLNPDGSLRGRTLEELYEEIPGECGEHGKENDLISGAQYSKEKDKWGYGH